MRNVIFSNLMSLDGFFEGPLSRMRQTNDETQETHKVHQEHRGARGVQFRGPSDVDYNMDFGEPIGVCRVAALMTFKDGLIVRNELFFDTRPFEKN